jgi:hypothetical protein
LRALWRIQLYICSRSCGWRADEAWALVSLRRDRSHHLGTWWATGFFRWLGIGYLTIVPMNAVWQGMQSLLDVAVHFHFHIFGFLYSVSSKHRHSGDYDAMGRIGPPNTERCNTCIPPVANAVFYIKHRLTAETQLCPLQSHALYFIQSTPRPSPSGRAIRPRCLPHLPQVLARPSKSRALARRRTPQQRRGRPNDHRYAPPHSHLSSRPSQNSH